MNDDRMVKNGAGSPSFIVHCSPFVVQSVWLASFFFTMVGVCLRVLGPADVIGYSTNLLVELFVFVGASFWAMHLMLTRRMAWIRSPLVILIALFFALALVSALRAPHLQKSLPMLFDWLACIVVFFLAIQFSLDKRAEGIFIHAIIACAAVVALYGIFQYHYSLDAIARLLEKDPIGILRQMGQPPDSLPDVLARVKDKRIYATFANPNSLAGFLLMTLGLSVGVLIDTLRRRQEVSLWRGVAIMIVTLIQAHALVLTFSKGGFVSLAVMAAVFAMLALAPPLVKRYRALCIAAGIAISLAAVAGSAAVIHRVASEGLGEASQGAEGSFRVRLGYWAAATKMIRDFPLLGVGLEHFGDFYPRYKPAEAGEVQRPHNNYLQVAAEMGIPGLIAFLLLWAGFVWAAVRTPGMPRETEHKAVAHGPPHERAAFAAAAAAGIATFVLVGLVFGSLETFPSRWESFLAYALMTCLWLTVFLHGARETAAGRGDAPPDYRFARIGIAAGIIGFLVHGLADFDLYVPGCSQTAWLFAALAIVLREPDPSRRIISVRTGSVVAATAAILAVTGLLIVPGWGLFSRAFEAETLVMQARQKLHDDQMTEKKYAEAIELIERSVQQNPLDDATWYLLGQACESVWQGSGRKDGPAFHGAIRSFRKAVEMNPHHSAALYRIAVNYREAAMYEKGLLMQRLADSDINTIELAAKKLGEPDVAAKLAFAAGSVTDARYLPYVWAASQAVETYPTNPHYRAALAEAFYLAGDKTRAAAEYATALQYDREVTVKRLKLRDEDRRQAEDRSRGEKG